MAFSWPRAARIVNTTSGNMRKNTWLMWGKNAPAYMWLNERSPREFVEGLRDIWILPGSQMANERKEIANITGKKLHTRGDFLIPWTNGRSSFSHKSSKICLLKVSAMEFSEISYVLY